MNTNKIILDLCGGTGSWSRPYKEAGYDVRVITIPQYDVTQYTIDKDRLTFDGSEWLPFDYIYGILAAPPCTMFSLARTTAKTPRDLNKGMEVVKGCLNVIWDIKPKFWAMENPKGLLRKFMGKPAFEFDASEFGETYNKHTDLWGYFKQPKKIREYKRYKSTDKNTRKLPNIPEDYVIDENMSRVAIKRSITPGGFANAFFLANK